MNFIKQLFICRCWSCYVTCRWWKAYWEPTVDQHQSCVFRRREQHLITRNYCPLLSVGVGNTLLWYCDGADSGPGNATWIEGGSWKCHNRIQAQSRLPNLQSSSRGNTSSTCFKWLLQMFINDLNIIKNVPGLFINLLFLQYEECTGHRVRQQTQLFMAAFLQHLISRTLLAADKVAWCIDNKLCRH